MNDPTNEQPAGTDTSAAQAPAIDLEANQELLRIAVATAKLRDAMAGFEPDFTPGEADAAGAFREDALDEDDAREAGPEWPRFLAAILGRPRA